MQQEEQVLTAPAEPVTQQEPVQTQPTQSQQEQQAVNQTTAEQMPQTQAEQNADDSEESVEYTLFGDGDKTSSVNAAPLPQAPEQAATSQPTEQMQGKEETLSNEQTGNETPQGQPGRHELLNSVFEFFHVGPQKPSLEPAVQQKETAAPEQGAEPIVLFSAEKSETPQVIELASDTIHAVQTGNRITLGAKIEKVNQQAATETTEAADYKAEENPMVAESAPVMTLEGLADMLDAIDKLTAKLTLKETPPEAATAENKAEPAQASTTTPPLEAPALSQAHTMAHEETTPHEQLLPEIVLLVSEDIFTLVERVQQLLTPEQTQPAEQTEQATTHPLPLRKSRLRTQEQEPHVLQFVTISSGEKEIVIELAVLRKLIEAHQKKGVQINTSDDELLTALEEMGLSTMHQRGWINDQVFWYLCTLAILSFAQAVKLHFPVTATARTLFTASATVLFEEPSKYSPILHA